MTKSEVADTARPLVDLVGEMLDPDRKPVWRGIEGAPCERPDGTNDPDVYWYLVGAQIMDVPVDEHIALLARLHDAVVERKWSVTYFATHKETGTAALVCTHPRTGYEVAVNSTTPPTALALVVTTPGIGVVEETPEPDKPPKDIRDVLG